jgi:hypothetical protein
MMNGFLQRVLMILQKLKSLEAITRYVQELVS